MSFYGRCYRRVLWPGYEFLRGRQTWRLYRAALERQHWNAARLAEFQFDELRRLLRHAFERCPWHRERWLALGISPADIRQPDDFRHLPRMTKDDIRKHREQMRARNFWEEFYEHKTGGSTGAPLQFDLHRHSYEWRMAVSLRGYQWAGCEDGERQFYVWGQPIGAPPLFKRLKTRLHQAVLRRRVFSSFRFGEEQMRECLRQLNEFCPRTVVGYTNPLCLLSRFILDTKANVPPLRSIITAAEGVNAVQRDLIERAFCAPVFASYGSREFMLIAMECEQHHGLHISADNLLVEIVRPDGTAANEGELGEIVITDLHNYAMPFIRYHIGDLGVTTPRRCACGRNLPFLERVEGRVLDVIRTPDGNAVPGEFFPHLLKEFNAVRQFQVVQKRLDHLQLKLVLYPGEHVAQLHSIQQAIRQALGSSIVVDIEQVPDIPLTSSGKFRVTVSELPPP